jgi:hypothetical protein
MHWGGFSIESALSQGYSVVIVGITGNKRRDIRRISLAPFPVRTSYLKSTVFEVGSQPLALTQPPVEIELSFHVWAAFPTP